MCEKESVEKGKGCMYRMCTSNGERVVLFWSDNVRTPPHSFGSDIFAGDVRGSAQ